jgi:flagellar hook-associated protein 1 FlgK
MSSFTGIDIGLRALMAAQASLAAAAANTANASTPGYSRIRARLVDDAPPLTATGANSPGFGVRVDGFERIRDAIVDLQWRAAAAEGGEQERMAAALEQVEAAFPSDGINDIGAAFRRFVGAWNDVASDPTSSAARSVALEATRHIASRLNSAASQLNLAADGIDAEVRAKVDIVNGMAREIADLNGLISISGNSADSGAANALIDRRDLLIDQIATYGRVTVTTQGDAGFIVLFGGGALVSGGATQEITTMADPVSGRVVPAYAASGKLTFSSGEFKGLIEARDTKIAAYRTALNAYAGEISTAVNAIHAAGVDTTGNPAGNLFSVTVGNEAATIAAAINDPAFLSVASAPSQPGNNDTASAIAALRTTRFMSAGTETPGDAFARIVTTIGADVSGSIIRRDAAGLVGDHLTARRESVSGVNIDEEAANTLRAQRAYQAAARIVSVADSMLDVLLGMGAR